MQQYGKVFKFLITSGRVSWVLQEDFSILKGERKAATSEQYHKVGVGVSAYIEKSNISKLIVNFSVSSIAAIVQALDDAVYERFAQLFNLYRPIRELDRI